MIVWLPAPKALVLRVATPLALRVPVPKTVLPSMKVTFPVGFAEPRVLATTVAVNVIDWPDTAELAELVMRTVGPSPTVCVRVPLAALKFSSPP